MEIIKKKFQETMIDLMEGCESWTINVDGQHGIVSLMDISPRLVPVGRTADSAILQAARTSTGGSLKSPKEDRTLLRYLYRNKHTTPLEMVTVKFKHVLPIFVARQLIRHRMASVNEFSMRYAEPPDRFWFPKAEDLRGQSGINKQAADGSVGLDVAEVFVNQLDAASNNAMAVYQQAVKGGIGRELSRTVLPVNIYTEWVWSCDLHNILHFLGLRQDSHAQAEIRVYANAMYKLLQPLVPDAIEAYDDYHVNRGAMVLSRLDLKALSGYPVAECFTNARELEEFITKAERIGHTTLAVRELAAAYLPMLKAKK